MVAVTFVGFCPEVISVLGAYRPLGWPNALRFVGENPILSVCAIGVVVGWLRATYLRIVDLGVQPTAAFVLSFGALACACLVASLNINAGRNRLLFCELLLLQLPLMLFSKRGGKAA